VAGQAARAAAGCIPTARSGCAIRWRVFGVAAPHERHFPLTLRLYIVLAKGADSLVAAHLNRERL
jgi:hypothetical protein